MKTQTAWTASRSIAIGGLIAALCVGGCGSSPKTSTMSSSATATGARVVSVDGARLTLSKLADNPFGVAVTPDGRYGFVATLTGHLLVFALTHRQPRLIRTLTLSAGDAEGCSLTRDGSLLLIASGSGVEVVSVARAASGFASPVLGVLRPPARISSDLFGAIETASSPNGRYVFVAMEYGRAGGDGGVVVYDIGSVRSPRFGTADYVGAVYLGQAVVGLAMAPNGRYLYATSEVGGPTIRSTRPSIQSVNRTSDEAGTISVLDAIAAEHGSAHVVLRSVAALEQPVRVVVSADGSTLWLTARASDRLLAFSTSRLLSDPANARVADVPVGTAPVGLAPLDRGKLILVADSDRFDVRGAHPALSVVDVHAALAHRPAVLATLPAGLFPREIAANPSSDFALVSDFGSAELETVDLARFRP